ncbi:MAG: hydantoinase/oxoprolinase family protein [Actinomycetia bacterium]|nr:hydantoinase/oxoprolinase family protein [Actinomycetes bacterium]
MKIGIGIDTGGTYTDAVVLDFDSRTILGSSKALTTKEDLSLGILAVLDALPSELLHQAAVLALSTTLATNACVEDKGGQAKLAFFGGDIEILDKYGAEYGLPPSSDIYIQESFTDFSGDIEREPDWDLFRSQIASEFSGLDGVGIIEMNALVNSAVVEKRAKEVFASQSDTTVVCGHQLFNELNSLQRASGTLLNARLFPVIREFIAAIKAAMRQRDIDAAVVIVRSDGSLMSEEFTSLRPVETLLCGPAASVIGSAYLTNQKNSVVVDMGGTTTDIALISKGLPYMVSEGVSIGKWRTFVNGLYIKTVGLGGDSAVRYRGMHLVLEDFRVVPFCVAAQKHPQIVDNLRFLLAKRHRHSKFLYEHYLLLREIDDDSRYNDEEKLFCAGLKGGPKPIREAADSVPGKDIYSLDVSRLLKEGVVQLIGLTPTDIMHIRGDYTDYCVEAATLAAEFVAANLMISLSELCDAVYDEVKRKLYSNIVQALLENKDQRYLRQGVGDEVKRFIDESYELAKTGFKHDFISIQFNTDYALTGVGAPIHLFLPDVAKMLGAQAVIPQHYEVANALGAVVGNVFVELAVEIFPNYSKEAIDDYTVFGVEETKTFRNREAAEQFAMAEAQKGARKEAARRGAVGEVRVTCELRETITEAVDCPVYLGAKAVAQAVGSVGL